MSAYICYSMSSEARDLLATAGTILITAYIFIKRLIPNTNEKYVTESDTTVKVSATPPKSKYMLQIDGLRTTAILLVMFGHWTLVWASFELADLFLATSGVNLFFVLSGFLISLILINNKAEPNYSNGHILRQFYIRRFLRIFPLYYLIVFIGFIFFIPKARSDIYWLISYLANWRAIQKNGSMGQFSHLWSLSVEEQFYIFFPLLLLLLKRTHTKALAIGLITVGVLSRAIPFFLQSLHNHLFWFSYVSTFSCLDSFGLGTLLACLYTNCNKALISHLNKYKIFYSIPACIAILGYVFLPKESMFNTILFRLLISISCFWLIGKAAYSDIKGLYGKFLQNKAIVYLGKISYGLYVYHYFMPYLYRKFEFSSSTNVSDVVLAGIVYFFTTLLIASISFYLYEYPINKLKKHFEYK